MSRRFVVVDTTGRTTYPAEATAKLAALDVHIEPLSPCDQADLIRGCQHADVILVTAAEVTRQVLEALPRLKGVVRYGVGLDRIDVAAAKRLGVRVANVRDVCTHEMAEHALALLLACTRHLVGDVHAVRAGRWGPSSPRPVFRLHGGCAGIIGFGAIGRAVAWRLRAMGLSLIAYDPYASREQAETAGAQPVGLDALLGRADVVSVHCALTDETRHLLGPGQLAAMKPTAILINTSRGGVIDERALVAALRAGQLAGAGLDVLEHEPPPPDHPLLHMDNVVVTPHVGWYSDQALHDVVVGVFDQVARILAQTDSSATCPDPAGPSPRSG